MKKSVVVVSAGTDATAVGVQQALTRLGARVHFLDTSVVPEERALSPDTVRLLTGMGYEVTEAPNWGQAAGILVGGQSVAEIEAGGGARYNGGIDSRAASGAAIGY